MAASAPQSGSRTQRGLDRRREILDAARQVFSAKGYEGASMADIAEKVGVVEGAIYKHFGGKRELLFETTRTFYEPLIESMERELQGILGSRNRLRFVIYRHLSWFADHPEFCRLIIQEIRPYDDYYGSVVRELNRKATSQVLAILEEASDAGELRAGVRPTLVRDVIFGGIEHVAWKALAGRATLEAQALADEVTQLIVAGIEEPDAASRGGERELRRLRAQIDRLEAIVSQLSKPKARHSESRRKRR